MAILWRDAMSVDGGLIDQDHQVLIAIINEFSAVPPDPGADTELKRILSKLDSYTKTHFAREEGLQKSIQYLYRDAHRHEHVDLIDQLTRVRAELAAVKEKKELIAAHTHMTDFLHHWLIDHILQTDLRMKPFAAHLRKHAAQLGGLAQAVET